MKKRRGKLWETWLKEIGVKILNERADQSPQQQTLELRTGWGGRRLINAQKETGVVLSVRIAREFTD